MSTPPDQEPKPVHNYPEMFSLRVMGENQDDFDMLVREIVVRHVEGLDESNYKHRSSNGGKYLSVTVTFLAESQEQVEALYKELNSHPRVLMIL